MTAVKRLFLAIPLPARLKEDIAEALPILERYTSGSTRFVSKDNLHITLAFLGARPAEEVGRIAELTRETVRVAPFELTTTSFGCFSGPGRARVLWLGATSGPEMLRLYEGLAAALADELSVTPAKAGIHPDRRPFQPHITVGRNKKPGLVDIKGLNERVRIVRPIPVEKVTLFESLLGREGSRHIVVEDFDLQAPPLTGGDQGEGESGV